MAMEFLSIFFSNHTPLARSYAVLIDDECILGTARNTILTPWLKPGAKYSIAIEARYYVWAKLTDDAEPVYHKAKPGSVLQVDKRQGKAVVNSKSKGLKPGFFALRTGASYQGYYGLAVKIGGIGFRPITTGVKSPESWHLVNTNTSFMLGLNDNLQYKDGDKLGQNESFTYTTKVPFRLQKSEMVMFRDSLGDVNDPETASYGEDGILSQVHAKETQRRLADEAADAVRKTVGPLAEVSGPFPNEEPQETRAIELPEAQELTRGLEAVKEQLAESKRKREELERQLSEFRNGIDLFGQDA